MSIFDRILNHICMPPSYMQPVGRLDRYDSLDESVQIVHEWYEGATLVEVLDGRPEPEGA